VKWYERLVRVHPVFTDDEGNTLRPLNRAERRNEARTTRRHGDGRKRHGVIDSEVIDSLQGKGQDQ
jgi:hypothetical protein